MKKNHQHQTQMLLKLVDELTKTFLLYLLNEANVKQTWTRLHVINLIAEFEVFLLPDVVEYLF